jgi:quercetin dioxygenase-like cupin family protein
VPLHYDDFLSADAWEPLAVSAEDPSFYWSEGGFMTSAPVDVAATFDGAMWTSNKLDPWFQARPTKVKAGFTIPLRHHNLRQLMLLIDGEIDVEYDLGEGTQHVAAGEFWICEVGTPYTMTAGPEGATYIECWDDQVALIETYWHDDKSWIRK